MKELSLITRTKGNSTIIFVALMLILVTLGIYLQQQNKRTSDTLPEFENLIVLPKPKALGEVNFQTHTGQPFSQQNLLGKWTILFFAFTNCPDICPSTLHTLKQVKSQLEPTGAWDAFQVAMITVDPERDSLERMRQYVPFFDKEFIGLRGALSYTEQFAKNVGILFFKRDVLENGEYDVDHGASLILVNPEGLYAGVIPGPHKVASIKEDLNKLGLHSIKKGDINTNQTFDNGDKGTVDNPETSQPASDVSDSALTASNAWIRTAPPGAPAMAGYVTLKNQGNSPISIIGVTSPEFKMAMIHNTVIENGVASMDHLDEITLNSRETKVLEPMGMHLMLVGANKDIAEGDIVSVELELEDGNTTSFELVVKTSN